MFARLWAFTQFTPSLSTPRHSEHLEKLIWASCPLRNIDFVVMVLESRHPNDN